MSCRPSTRNTSTRTIPLNFFWELKKNVIDPLGKRRPSLAQEFSENEVLDAFVEKRARRLITDVVSLRKVMSIIRIAEREVDDSTQPSVLDDTLRRRYCPVLSQEDSA